MMSASVAGRMPARARVAPRRRPPLPQHRVPPARTRLPVALVVSVVGHLVVLVGLMLLFTWTALNRPQTYVVNLVPMIAAVGVPTAPPSPSPPVKAAAPAPPVRNPSPDPTPRAEAPARPVRLPEPARPPEPTRLPEPAKLPPPARLPDPSWSANRMPPKPTLPRPGEKDLPPLANPRVASALPTTRGEKVDKPAESRPGPSATLGLPTGSTAGVGAVSVTASDFPHAWYLRQVVQKVEAEWKRQNRLKEPNQRPLLFFEIQRDGSIKLPKLKETSGNSTYDQAALRAVVDASPFPPLPQDWSRPSLGIDLMFYLSNPG